MTVALLTILKFIHKRIQVIQQKSMNERKKKEFTRKPNRRFVLVFIPVFDCKFLNIGFYDDGNLILWLSFVV